jgi:hypothetical protein
MEAEDRELREYIKQRGDESEGEDKQVWYCAMFLFDAITEAKEKLDEALRRGGPAMRREVNLVRSRLVSVTKLLASTIEKFEDEGEDDNAA